MNGPKAPKDAEKKRQGFYIMRGKQVAGLVQPDGRGTQFIYLNDGRMVSSARIVGNITDETMLELLKTAEGFKKLVHSIGVSVEADDMEQTVDFVFQVYGKRDAYGSGSILRMPVKADGMEQIMKLSDYEWSDDDDIPGQIRFEFDQADKQAVVAVRLYLNDGFTAPEPEKEDSVEFESAAYREMIAGSLVQAGNNVRLKTVIDRARRGEDVTIAFLGGSITQGAGAVPINKACYAYQTFKRFCELTGKGTDENIHYIKAGVGGTPSELGMLRYDRDVLRNGAVTPDIVVVEFAVNDEGDETKGECYDSLVRRIYASPNKPAVLLLFSVFANDENLQERLSKVGRSYDLPMVSIKDCVVKQFYKKAGAGRVVSKNQFFYDCYHPTNTGHIIMADCLLHLMKTVDDSAMDLEEPDIGSIRPPYGAEFQNVKLLDRKQSGAALKLSCGDFTETDEELQAVEMDENLFPTKEFPNNWMHCQGDAPFEMDIRCSALILIFKDSASPETGCAEVYVDGEKVLFADPKVNGWTHCNPLICFRGREYKEYHVEVRMQPGDENKKFTILGFGYVEE